MKHNVILWALAAIVTSLVAAPAFAGTSETGNGCPSGAHFNLNLIGMEKAKNIDPDYHHERRPSNLRATWK